MSLNYTLKFYDWLDTESPICHFLHCLLADCIFCKTWSFFFYIIIKKSPILSRIHENLDYYTHKENIIVKQKVLRNLEWIIQESLSRPTKCLSRVTVSFSRLDIFKFLFYELLHILFKIMLTLFLTSSVCISWLLYGHAQKPSKQVLSCHENTCF